MVRGINRRKVIKGVGAASIVGLSGCLGDGGSGTTAGGGGLEIDWQVEDTQTARQASINGAESLINAGYPAINGPASSGNNVPVSQEVYIPNQIVGCSPSSTALSVSFFEDDDYIYRTAPSDLLQGQVMAQVTAETLGDSTAATLYVNNDYGQQLSNQFTETYEGNHGGTVQTQEAFNKNESSYSSVIETALSDDPGALIVIGYPQSGIQLFRDYYSDTDGGHDIVVPDGLRDDTLPDKVGNEMANVTGTAPGSAGPNKDAFNDLYNDEYGEDPGVFAPHTFDSAAVLMLANALAGENSGQAVRNHMRRVAQGDGMEVGPGNLAEGVMEAARGNNVVYEGASSPVDFDKRGDPAAATYNVWEFGSDGTTNTESIEFTGNPGGPTYEMGSGGTDRTIMYGILLPETGDLGSLGTPMIQAGELAGQVVQDGM
jgi:ABC-type branched-subunit amino acid transport system substrate-binding protein